MASLPPRPGLFALLRRGLARRCPLCARGKVYESYFQMRSRCPSCGYPFEREEGYWVGALVVNMAVAEIWFALLFVAVLVATLPDVAWVPLLVVALVTNGIVPVIFYPFSKTLWMAIDLHFHPARALPTEGDRWA